MSNYVEVPVPTADVEPGDGGRSYAKVILAGVTVTTYESLDRPGVIVVEVDYADEYQGGCVVYVNDGQVHELDVDHYQDDDEQPAPVPHADYPHNPGTLYDCLRCESECFCMELNKDQRSSPDGTGDGVTCVHCAVVNNPDEPDTCDGMGNCPPDAHIMRSVWTTGNHRFMGTSTADTEQCMTCGAHYRMVRVVALPLPDTTPGLTPWFVWRYVGGAGEEVTECSRDTGRVHGIERVCQNEDCRDGRAGEPCSHTEHDCQCVLCY